MPPRLTKSGKVDRRYGYTIASLPAIEGRQAAQIVALYKSGWTVAEIADAYAAKGVCVDRLLKKHGLIKTTLYGRPPSFML